MHNTRVVSFARALVLAGSLVGAAALAQGTAVLTGTVVDASTKQPVGDVVVTATSPNLQGEQIVVTDASGVYRIPQLPSGVYTIRLEKESFKPFSRGDIQIRVDRTIRVNVEMLPEALKAEEIVVVGRAPVIDVGSTNTGVNIGSDFVRNISVSRPGGKGSASRSFESLAEFAPGANADQYGMSISGTTSPENSFVIDGLSVNDPGYGILGTPLSVEFIQEVNVITGGYMPEYGRATGGIMNAVTKSGSNEFHGSIWGNLTPGVLAATSPEIKSAGTSIFTRGASGDERIWNLGDFGAEIGGPILKDKLWFYAGIAPSFTRYRLERILQRAIFCTEVNPEQGCTAIGAAKRDPSTGFSVFEPIPGLEPSKYFADERSIQYIGKLTYLLSQDHSLTLSVYGTPTWAGGDQKIGVDPQDGSVEVVSFAGPIEAIGTRYNASATDVAAKWSSSFLDKHFLIDATVGWHHQVSSIHPMDDSKTGGTEGLAGDVGTIFRRTRRHSILDFNQWEQIPEDIAAQYCDPAGTASATKCPVTGYNIGGPRYVFDSNLDRYQGKVVATYLLNALGHHVMKAGVDVEFLSYYNAKARTGGVTLRESTSGTSFTDFRQYGYLTGPDEAVIQPVQIAQSNSNSVGAFVQDSWNIADVITLNAGLRYDQQVLVGADKEVGLALGNQWSPRIGLIYDFTQSGRSKIFANFARFYEAVPLDMVDRSFPGERQIISVHARSTAAGGCNPIDPSTVETGCASDANRLVINDPFNPNQIWTPGGGDKVPVDPNLKPQSSDEFVVGGEYEVVPDGRAGVSYTKRYMNSVIEDMSRDEATTYFIGNPGEGIAKDFPRATRDYDAVTVYFTKAFSDLWLAQASYTWSRLYGNYPGLFKPETGQLDPNINSDFDLISLLDNRTGQLPGDRTHSLKIFGAKEFVLGSSASINIGLTYRARSGGPLNYLGSHPLYGAGEVFVLPRGSGGRLDWVHVIDTHVGFTYKFSKDYTVMLTADVFNLFNFQAITGRSSTFTATDVQPLKDGTVQDIENCTEGAPAGACKIKRSDGETAFTAADINPNFKNVTAYQAPRTIRFGVKVTF